MLASSRSSQAACSSADGSPSGFCLPRAPAIRPEVYSACRQVSRCGPCFHSVITPSRRCSSPGRLVSAWWTRVRWAGRPPAWVRHMPASSVRTLSWRERTPMGSTASIRGAMPEAPVISSTAASVIMTAGLPRAAGPPASPAGSSPAIRSPSRWEQVIPAACMNVASPSWSAQPASQVARSRDVSSRGRPLPPSSAATSGFVRLRRPGSVPHKTRPSPANRAAASSRPW